VPGEELRARIDGGDGGSDPRATNTAPAPQETLSHLAYRWFARQRCRTGGVDVPHPRRSSPVPPVAFAAADSLGSWYWRLLMTRKISSAVATLALLLGGGSAAYAKPVTYILQTPGVV